MSTLVDGHFWLTYSEILPDEKCLTCAEFVRRAPACFRGHGITTIEHVMTGYISRASPGCVLSASVTAYLARGLSLYDAVVRGKEFVTESIRTSLRLGKGVGPVNAGTLPIE